MLPPLAADRAWATLWGVVTRPRTTGVLTSVGTALGVAWYRFRATFGAAGRATC